MNKEFNNWKDYLVLLLMFFSTSFIANLLDLMKGKITKKDFFKSIVNNKRIIFSFIIFICFILFFIFYEVLEII